MPRWLKIALAVVGGAAAVIAAIVYFALWATSGLIEPVERQIAALKSGNIEAAYAETSQAFQQATPLPAFIAFVDRYPILKDVADHSFSNRRISNGVGYLEGSLTASTGAVVPVGYRLVKENDTWKILYMNVGGA